MDLVPPELRRKNLFPAGRLDKDTEGFVLITDDGAFAHRKMCIRDRMNTAVNAPLMMTHRSRL